MIKINLITVGKLKEKYWRDACAEYAKRLSAFCDLQIVELAESRLSDSPSQKEITIALENEAKAMSQYLERKQALNIAMCIEGRQFASATLADKLNDYFVSGYSTINFIIGSSFGISEQVKKQCQLKLSMSEMTFPHQLARVMLLEQIYRCFQIQNHTKYHK